MGEEVTGKTKMKPEVAKGGRLVNDNAASRQLLKTRTTCEGTNM